MKLIATKKTFEISLDNAVEIFAEAIGSPKANVSVEYVIREAGADPMDRFPGIKQVTGIRINVRE